MPGSRPVCVARHRTSRWRLSPPNNLTKRRSEAGKKTPPKKGAALKGNCAVTDLHSQRPRYKGPDHNSRQRAATASGSVVTAVPPHLSPRRGPQLQCAFCNKPFPKTSKRSARCCSPRCSKALLRETARLDG